MDRSTIETLIKEVYQGVDAMKISLNYRSRNNINSSNFVYGEIKISSFCDILDFINLNENDIFYDLGSGSGKAVLAAYLYKNPQKAIGIEYIPDLVEVAKKSLKKLEEKLSSNLNIEFINADMRNYDFSNGTCFFIHATTWQEDLMNPIKETLKKTNSGTKIILVTKSFEEPKYFKLLKTEIYPFDWGEGTVRFYLRV